MGVLLHPLLLLGMYCIFSIFCTPVAGIDPETEKFLTGLTKSKISLFTTTSSTVYHMETDKYKPGYVVYTDVHALKTSDGNTTMTITGGTWPIQGFTQLSSTTIIVSDSGNHCLRQVDRVTRVTSVFAGQCKSHGYQDGSSAKFYHPKAVIIDKKNSKQLLVVDQNNRAVRTIDVESKSVGTFIKSDQLSGMRDMVQHLVTGDIYIAVSGLIKVDYVTKSIHRLSVYSYTNGLSVLDATTLLLAEPNKNSVTVYDIAHDTQNQLNICQDLPVPEFATQCHELGNPQSVMLSSKKLLIGLNHGILQVQPSVSNTMVTKNLTGITIEKPTVCRDRNITVYTNNVTGLATVKIIDGYDVGLEPGNHTLGTPGGHLNETCTTRVQVIDSSTVSSVSDLLCPDELVSLTSPESDLATFQLVFGDQEHSLMLPLGHYPYTIKSGENICNVTMIAEDYRVRRTLEFVADYLVDCAVINSTVTFSLLSDVAQQQFAIIDTLCDSACKGRAANAKPFITCKDSNRLRIRWPTDRVFPADVTRVPDDLRVNLESRIRNKGLTFNVVVFGASPPVVYPQKADNGGYASLMLTSTCIDGRSYSDAEQKCIQ